MKNTLILAIALTLASCGAQPLRTKEEATATAVSDAVAEASGQIQDEQNIVQEVQPFSVVTDDVTGCQYLVTNQGGITPRMKFNMGGVMQMGCVAT